MPSLLNVLDAFNRKERYFVVRFLIGSAAITIDGDFLDQLGVALNLQLPKDARWWMDYHLDWLYAALVLHKGGWREGEKKRYRSPMFTAKIEGDPPFNVNTNQEDVDLMMGFEQNETTHLILIEAKAETTWTNKQLRSKASRLETIFGADGKEHPDVTPHFVICSPSRPTRLKLQGLANWMIGDDGRLAWLRLPVDPDRLQIERCDSAGNATKAGDHWQVREKRLK